MTTTSQSWKKPPTSTSTCRSRSALFQNKDRCENFNKSYSVCVVSVTNRVCNFKKQVFFTSNLEKALISTSSHKCTSLVQWMVGKGYIYEVGKQMGSVVGIMIFPNCRAQNKHDIQDHPTTISYLELFWKLPWIRIVTLFVTHVVPEMYVKAQNYFEIDIILSRICQIAFLWNQIKKIKLLKKWLNGWNSQWQKGCGK